MTTITRIGLDLAKHVFEVHGVDLHGKPVLRKTLSRSKVVEFFAQLPPCVVGMEACASSHYWARELAKLGHTAQLMAPQCVRPYRKNEKNDRNDAEAICEAVSRPTMRFVPVKSVEQHAVLTVQPSARALGRIRDRGGPGGRPTPARPPDGSGRCQQWAPRAGAAPEAGYIDAVATNPPSPPSSLAARGKSVYGVRRRKPTERRNSS